MALGQFQISKPEVQIPGTAVVKRIVNIQRLLVHFLRRRKIAAQIKDICYVAQRGRSISLVSGLLKMKLGLPIQLLGSIKLSLVGKINCHIVEDSPSFGMLE